MRASRLLTVLLLLQNRGRMTAEELAEELEVSVRTVYRDIYALSASGVPVYADRGRTGGYRLADGYRTRLTGMTEEEAQSLSRAGRVAERFYLDVPGWHRGIESLPALSAVADAVWSSHRIRIRYERWGQRVVEREVEPLGLILKAGNWYLAGRCEGTDRTYRISRVLELTDLGEVFERPAGFDLARYWQEWSEQFERRMFPRVAVVRLSPRAQALVPFYAGCVGARALRECRNEPDADGWLTVELPVEPGEPAIGELLRFGSHLEVLEPADLRAELAEAIEEMGAIYG